MSDHALRPQSVSSIRGSLLAWYAANRRDLPWRRTSDPYAIWVSEIMLQQTRVAAVIERYRAFLARFPDIVSLAGAPECDILALWSGLGYYRRARMMHKTAQLVAVRGHAGLPASAVELRALPGIGAYTAGAIASIAFGEPVAVVDGNVERVLCRLMGWNAERANTRRKVEDLAAQLVHPQCPGDFNQAVMELGAIICLPRSPRCMECPLRRHCLTRGEHKTGSRPPMQTREIAHALAVRDSIAGPCGEVLLEQRAASQSVMPGLWELPALRNTAVPPGDLRMTVRHSIMHVNYTVHIRSTSKSDVDAITVAAGRRQWISLQEVAQMPLTGLARKVLSRAHLLPVAQR